MTLRFKLCTLGSLLGIFSFISQLSAQPSQSGCEAYSLLSSYKGKYGTWKDQGATIVITESYNGIQSGRHTQLYANAGFLAYPNPNKSPYVGITKTPPGKPYAIQLGNFQTKRQWESLSTTIQVDENNAFIVVWFAVVLQNPNHTPIQQPKFIFKAYDSNDNLLNCGEYVIVSGGNIPGFQSQGNIVFRDWTSASLDLRNYIGQEVRIEFTTYDCSEGGHFGTALFAVECLKAEITTAEFYCPGVDTVITLVAPEGFTNYKWSNGDTGPIAQYKYPKPGDTYKVTFQPFSSLSPSCILEMEYTVPNPYEFPPNDTVAFCAGGSLQIKAPDFFSGTTYLWNNGASTQAINVNQPGDYQVKIYYKSCELQSDFYVEETPIPFLQTTLVKEPRCPHESNGRICADLVLPNPLATIKWAHGPTTNCIDSLPKGSYVLKSEYKGCSDMLEIKLEDTDSLIISTVILKTPRCDNHLEGLVSVNVAGGQKPYSFLWSNNDSTQVARVDNSGTYVVTVTDSRYCTDSMAIYVQELDISLISRHNYCYRGNQGSVGVFIGGGVPPYQYTIFPIGVKNEPFVEGLISGDYWIVVEDATGCQKLVEAEIRDLRTVPLETIITPLTFPVPLKFGDLLDLSVKTDYALKAIRWETPSLNPPFCDTCRSTSGKVISDGPIKVFSTDNFGCRDTALISIKVIQEYDYYIPNVFCPRAKEKDNRVFRVFVNRQQFDDLCVVAFDVFDRFGSLVFSARNLSPDSNRSHWDGMIGNKPAPEGVYVWTLQLRLINGAIVHANGDVTLTYDCGN